MTPMGALTLAILAGLAIGLVINRYVRRGDASRQQLVRRTQFINAFALLVLAGINGAKVVFSSTSDTFTVVLAVATGALGVVFLVQALRSKAVQ